MPFNRLLVPLSLFFLLSFQPAVSQTSKALPGQKQATKAAPAKKAEQEISWQQNRKLTWADFKGKADPSEPKYALTTSDMKVGVNCNDDQFSYTVKATFIPAESWTRSLDSNDLLAHEQLHFDITELHARKLRLMFSSLPNGCLVPGKEIEKLINQAFEDWHKMEEEYDEATRHGLNKEAQLAWQKTITAALAALAQVQ